MDTRRLIIAVVLAMAVTLGWQAFRSYMCSSHNWNCDPEQKAPEVVTPPPTTNVSTPAPGYVAVPAPGSSGASMSAAPTSWHVLANSAVYEAAMLGAAHPKDRTYALGLHVDPNGAGIQEVTLNDYQDAQELHTPYVFEQATDEVPLATGVVNINGITAPCWLKLTRAGDVFAAFYSADGATWKPLGVPQTIPMNALVLVGIANTSHVDNALCTSTVDNVAVTPAVGAASASLGKTQDIGSPSTAGTTSSGAGVYTIQGAGSDIQGTTDQGHYAYASLSGDGSVVARVSGQTNTHPWAKTGLMIRNTLDPDSANAFVAVTPEYGVTFQWRNATGGATSWYSYDGMSVDLGRAQWHLDGEATATKATYAIELGEADTARLRILKTYEVFPRSGGSPGSQGYEAHLTYALQNLTTAPLNVKLSFNGPALPPRELDSAGERQVVGGFGAPDRTSVVMKPIVLEGMKPSVEVSKYDKDDYRFLWAGTVSAYFAAIVQPSAEFAPVCRVTALRSGSAPQTPDELGVSVRYDIAQAVPASGVSTIPFTLFLGPKDRSLLNAPYYSGSALGYDSLLTTAGFCGTYCTFSWLIAGLIYMLKGFHLVLRDWGLAIIALVVVVRACLHPITKRSQVSMMKMTKLGPEIERLKKKHGDNKDELNKAMMGVYKEQGLTPVLGCLPMFLQMPIWIALYSALRTTIELRQAPFLWGFTWIHNLAKPDRLIHFEHPLVFWRISIAGINFLPLLLMVAFFLQQKFQPKPVAATPEQAQQQKMMQWMSLLFPVMLYTYPSGLNIYIFTSTIWGVLESKIIRDHIKQREEDEKAGRILVDAKPTRAGRQMAKDGKGEDEKPGCLTGWFTNLQQRAEDMRKGK